MTQNMVGGFYTSAIGFGYNTEVLKRKKLPEPRCRSGQAQAPNVAKGEVGIGVSFLCGFEKWRLTNYPVNRRAM